MHRVTLIVAILSFLIVSSTWGQESQTSAEVEKLIDQLSDDNPQIRQEATERLIIIGMPALEAAKKAMESEDTEVRLRAERIAATIAAKSKVTFSDRLLEAWPDIYNEMGRDMSPRGIFKIISRLTGNVGTGEYGEYNEIASRPFPREDNDVAALIVLMAEKGYEGLGSQEKMNVATLARNVHILSAKSGEISSEKREMLQRIVRALLPLLKDENDGIRLQAAMSLHQIDPREIAPLTDDLLPMLGHDHVRKMVEESLPFKDPKDLFALLKKGPKELRGTIIDLLATRRAKEYGDELRSELLPLLKDEAWSVRGRAAIALVELGRKADVPESVISDIKLFTAWNGPPSGRARAVLRELETGEDARK